MRQIQIVGGGLAGLSLGISLLKRGVPVTLFEAGTYPRHRVCGEFVSGVSEITLRSLGILDLFDGAVRARNCVWFDKEKSLLERPLPKAAWSISRFELDHALAERFRAEGGLLQTGVRVSDLTPREGVVFAMGRRRVQSPWVGLKMHARGLKLRADVEMHVTASGYVGLNRISPDHVNICGLFVKKGVVRAGNSTLAETIRSIGLETLFQRIRNSEYVPDSFCAVSAFQFGWQSRSAGNELSLGDAMAMIEPFTGNGMSMAFEGAAIVGEPVIEFAKGEVEWAHAVKEIRRKMRVRFGRRLFFSRIAHPILRQVFLLRAFALLGRVKPVAFAMVFDRTRT